MGFLRKFLGSKPEEEETPAPLATERLSRVRDRIEGVGPDSILVSKNAAAPALPESRVPLAPPPRPVVLARKPRERTRDWSRDRSWFGGLPRLGGVAWPCGANGAPLPFAAQIDLAELAAACPESPLPHRGSLAFFLNEGAVIHVAEGDHAPTEPPPGLPPAYEEGGYPLPERATNTSRPLFPFWPAEPIGLPVPESLRAYADEERHEEIWEAQHALLQERLQPREFAFSVYSARKEAIDGADDLWWFGVEHLVASLRNAMDGAPRLIAMGVEARDRAGEHLRQLEASADSAEEALVGARGQLEQAAARVAGHERQAQELPTFIAALENLVSGRDPWATLDGEALDVVRQALRALHNEFKDLVRYHVPRSTDELANLCIRRMITGDDAALDALPEAMLAFINERYRLTSQSPHQMFGLAGVKQANLYDHLDDLLLLQLGYDDLNEWCFGDMGLWHFWIGPEDAAAGRWDKATLTFECA